MQGMGGAIAGNIISEVAGDLWQNYWQKSSAKYARKEAARNRDFMREMSNTAWTRGVADMRRAGINPLLAVSQGGASTPGSGSGSGPGVPSAKAGNANYLAVPLLKSQIDLNRSQAEFNTNKAGAIRFLSVLSNFGAENLEKVIKEVEAGEFSGLLEGITSMFGGGGPTPMNERHMIPREDMLKNRENSSGLSEHWAKQDRGRKMYHYNQRAGELRGKILRYKDRDRDTRELEDELREVELMLLLLREAK